MAKKRVHAGVALSVPTPERRAMEILYMEVQRRQWALSGIFDSASTIPKIRVPVEHVPTGMTFDVVGRDWDERGPFLVLDGFGKVRDAAKVRLAANE